MTSSSSSLSSSQVEIHEDFMQDCMNRLQAMYDTVCALQKNKMTVLESEDDKTDLQQDTVLAQIQMEANRMIRILTVLKVYIAECDEAYTEERAILPLHRLAVIYHNLFSLNIADWYKLWLIDFACLDKNKKFHSDVYPLVHSFIDLNKIFATSSLITEWEFQLLNRALNNSSLVCRLHSRTHIRR